MIRIINGLLCLLLLGSMLGSCFKGSQNDELTQREIVWVDTLYHRMLDSLETEADRLCDDQFQSFYRQAVDSIRQVRLEEIDKMLRIQ